MTLIQFFLINQCLIQWKCLFFKVGIEYFRFKQTHEKRLLVLLLLQKGTKTSKVIKNLNILGISASIFFFGYIPSKSCCFHAI